MTSDNYRIGTPQSGQKVGYRSKYAAILVAANKLAADEVLPVEFDDEESAMRFYRNLAHYRRLGFRFQKNGTVVFVSRIVPNGTESEPHDNE